MTVAGAVQLGVIAILFVTIAAKIRGQTRQGVRAVFFLVSGVLVAAGIHVQILREERFLTGKFGDEYAGYCARVRRYLGPHGAGTTR